MNFKPGVSVGLDNPMPVKLVAGTGPFKPGQSVSDSNPLPVALIGGGDVSMPALAFASAVAQAEGNSGTTNFVFTLNLTRNGNTDPIPFIWTVQGTGTSPALPSDFVNGWPSGSGIFASGETSKTITVPIAGDTTVEPDKTFLLTAAPTTIAAIAATAIGTILNDDVVYYLNVSPDISKVEGDNGASIYGYRVTSSAPVTVDTQVPYAFVFGAGITGDDFTGGFLPAAGYVTIPAGQVNSNYANVSVNGDTAFENDEVFTIAFSTPPGFVAGPRMSATGTILNDDSSAPAPAFVKQSITPSTGPVGTVYTTRSSVTGGSVSSRQWLLNGTAISGATGVTYTSTAGGTLTCAETATGPGGSTTSTGPGATTVALSTFSDRFTSQAHGQPGAGQNGWLAASDPGGPVPTISPSGGNLDLGSSGGGSDIRPEAWFDHTQTVSTYHGANAAIGLRFGWTDANSNSYLLIFSPQYGSVSLYFGKPGAYGTALFTKDVYALIGGKAGGNSFSYTLTDDVLDIKIGDVSGDGQSAAVNLATVYTYTEVDTARRAKLVAGGQIGPYGAGGPDQQYVLRFDASGYLAVTHEAPAVVGFHRYGSTNPVLAAGLAAVAAAPTDGTVQKFIVVAGDSLTQAAYSAIGPVGLTNAFNTRSAKTTAQLLRQNGYPCYDKGFFGVGNNGGTEDDATFFAPYFGNLPGTSTPRCELGSFTVFNNGACAGGGVLKTGTGAGFIYRDARCTKFRVPITNQVAGNLIFKVDGVVVGQPKAVGTDGTMTFVDVPAGAAGLHALTITSDTAGVWVNGVIPMDETSAAINLVVMGSSGSPTANLVSDAQPCSWRKAIALVAPILVRCLIYDNDVRLASGNPDGGAAQMRANLLTFDGFCTAAGSDLLFVTPPPSGSGNGNDFSQWQPYNTQMKSAGAATHRAVLSVADNKGGHFDPSYFNDDLTNPPNGFAHPSEAGQADLGTLDFSAIKLMSPSSFPDVVSGGSGGVSLTAYANPAPQAVPSHGGSGWSDWYDATTATGASGQQTFATIQLAPAQGTDNWRLACCSSSDDDYVYFDSQGSYGCTIHRVTSAGGDQVTYGGAHIVDNNRPNGTLIGLRHTDAGIQMVQDGVDGTLISWETLKSWLGGLWTDALKTRWTRAKIGSSYAGWSGGQVGQVDPKLRATGPAVVQPNGRVRVPVAYSGAPSAFAGRASTIGGTVLLPFAGATVISQTGVGQAIIETSDAVTIPGLPAKIKGADVLIQVRQDGDATRIATAQVPTRNKFVIGAQCWQQGISNSPNSYPYVSVRVWANRALGCYKSNTSTGYSLAAQKLDPAIGAPDPLVDADGIPMSDAIVWNLCQPDTSGEEQEAIWQGFSGNPAYEMTQGTGSITVTARGQKTIGGQTYEYQRYVYNFSSDISDVNTTTGQPFQRVHFPGSSSSNKPSKFDVRPATLAKDLIFNPTLLSLVQNLVTASVNGRPVFRLMELLNTNGCFNGLLWSERTKIGDYEARFHNGDGIGPEAALQLCIQATAHPWYCVPRYATADYEDGLIALFKATLLANTWMVLYWEWGNENWNSQLANGGPWNIIRQRVCQRKGVTDPGDGGGGVELNSEEHAFQHARFYDKMVAAGVPMDRVVSVMGGQTTDVFHWRQKHDYLASIGRVDSYDAVAVAPYIIPGGFDRDDYSSYTDAEIEAILTPVAESAVTVNDDFCQQANRAGKRFLKYEGGLDARNFNSHKENFIAQIIRKPLYGRVYTAHLDKAELQGDLYCTYAMFGGGWAVFNGVGQANPAWDAMLAKAAVPA